MPGRTYIRFLISLFAHLGDNRMGLYPLEKSVDIYPAPTFRKIDVLLRADLLVPQKNNPVFDLGLVQFSKLLVADSTRNIKAVNHRSQCRTHRTNLDRRKIRIHHL